MADPEFVLHIDDIASTQIESNWNQVIHSFSDINLSRELLNGIFEYGFEYPSPVQERSLPAILMGTDCFIQAPFGIDRTTAYIISILHMIDKNIKSPQALILKPTIELARNTKLIVDQLGKYIDIQSHACIGGRNIQEDSTKLKSGVQVILGTPGRTYDFINRKAFNIDQIKLIVVDQVDEIIERGLMDQLHEINQLLPNIAQRVIITASTLAEHFENTMKYLRNPIRIIFKYNNIRIKGIKQFYVPVDEGDKLITLCDIYEAIPDCQSIIFCNTALEVDLVTNKLIEYKLPVSPVHHLIGPSQFSEQLENSPYSNQILVVTDGLSNNIDLEKISLVISYNFPSDQESFIHRMSRWDQSDRQIIFIHLITSDDALILRRLISLYNVPIEELDDLTEIISNLN